ncbi:S8 family peptidase [Streptomyces sp. SAS_270]|uniref:S8 family peptidase n=1 Tax=Streptomyces sp. SAS_270 TaxID=3412748 RepID=UPI00403C4531
MADTGASCVPVGSYRDFEEVPMCDGSAAYSTVVGPWSAMMNLMEVWDRLETPRRFAISRPDPVQFWRISPDSERLFSNPKVPNIAVVHHEERMGIHITAALQAELTAGNPQRDILLPQLMWEPGYLFTTAGSGSQLPGEDTPPPEPHGWRDALDSWRRRVGRRIDVFDPEKLRQLIESIPDIPPERRAKGSRVAVLDTGMLDENAAMVDFLGCDQKDPATTTADDGHGHGTAVAHAIKAVNEGADIHPIRVLNEKCKGHSYEVLAGMIWAVFSGKYDLINASLSSPVSGSCDSALGRSIDYLLAYGRHMWGRVPVLVAAAGNVKNEPSGYPARLHGAVVALALDKNAQQAGYNSTPPPGSFSVTAYGGGASDPLGDLSRLQIKNGPTGADAKIWGTSFAAAAVSGAYLQ